MAIPEAAVVRRPRRPAQGPASVSGSLLAQAVDLLMRTLDYQQAVCAVADLLVPNVADWCQIFVGDDGESLSSRMVLAHVDPAKEKLLQAAWQRQPAELAMRHPLAVAIRSRQPTLVGTCTAADLETLIETPEDSAALARVGVRSMMVVPLVAHGLVVGGVLLALSDSRRRAYDDNSLQLLEQLGTWCGQAIYNARLYREAKMALRLRDELIGAVVEDLAERLVRARACSDVLRWHTARAGAPFRKQMTPGLAALEALVNEMDDLVRGLQAASESQPGTT
jgi:GAF domain-containing protein